MTKDELTTLVDDWDEDEPEVVASCALPKGIFGYDDSEFEHCYTAAPVQCRAPTVPLSVEATDVYPFIEPKAIQGLATQLARKLLQNGPFAFSDLERLPFEGGGTYAIYCQGGEQTHAPLVSMASTLPIYIGKAARCLWERLRNHAESIEQAQLGPENFTFRFLCLPEGLIEFGESNLISLYGPIWNVYLNGFGAKTTGGKRHSQASYWDTMFPGRKGDRGGQPRLRAEVEAGLEAAVQECRKQFERAQILLEAV